MQEKKAGCDRRRRNPPLKVESLLYSGPVDAVEGAFNIRNIRRLSEKGVCLCINAACRRLDVRRMACFISHTASFWFRRYRRRAVRRGTRRLPTVRRFRSVPEKAIGTRPHGYFGQRSDPVALDAEHPQDDSPPAVSGKLETDDASGVEGIGRVLLETEWPGYIVTFTMFNARTLFFDPEILNAAAASAAALKVI